ncbi:MAG: glycosyltransferase [Flavobacteriaceae bacterium]
MLKNLKTINLSNIRSGGAKQVAISFLLELKDEDFDEFNLLVSSEIYEELKTLNYKYLMSLKIYDSSIFKIIINSLIPEIRKAKLVFTLFGPLYAFTRAKTITGFAQAWILYPNNLMSRELDIYNKVKFRFKYLIQHLFFKKDNLLVTESDIAKQVLNKLNFKFVNVVNNSINTLFLSQTPRVKEVQKDFKIGVIGRNYPHKNLKILPQILDILTSKFESKVSFHVTLTEQEFVSMSESFQKNINNYGSLNVSECPKFYNEMDLIFFPSLLEVFSATPLESLYMKKPFVCSELSFNKGFLEDFAFYAKPNDAKDSAKVLMEVLELLKSNDQSLINKLNLGSEYIKNNFQPSNRAKAYLEIINSYE